jgi:hypothetical protein
MSKVAAAARNPQPDSPKPAPRERELAPPIFWSANDDEPKTLNAPIYLVYVYGFDKGGERIPLDCTPFDGLPSHAHELGAKYGHSPIELVARDEKGAVLVRVTHRTQVPPGTPAPAAVPANPSAPAIPAMDPLALMLAMNERTDKLMAMMLQSKDAASAQIVQAISQMSGARLTDAQELFSTLIKAKSPAGASPERGELAAFMRGMKYFEGLVDAGREAEAEGGGGGDDDWMSKLQTVAEVFQRVTAAQQAPQQPPLRVVNTEGTSK